MSFLSFGQRVAMCALFGIVLAGCSSEPTEPEYGFGEADMQSAIIGDWSGSMTLTGQAATTFTLSIARIPTLQPACGSRTFNAPLCVESSSMNVEGTLTTADKMFDAVKLQGSFMVIGLEFNHGELSLAGAGLNVFSGIDVGKTSHNVTVSGDRMGGGTMHR